MSRENNLLPEENDDTRMIGEPAVQPIGHEEASKQTACPAEEFVPAARTADHPPEPNPAHEPENDTAEAEILAPSEDDILMEAILSRDKDTIKEVLKEALKETLKEALKETLWESSKEPVVDQEDIDEATADIYDAPAEHIDAADEDVVLDALEENGEEAMAKALYHAFNSASGRDDIEWLRDFLSGNAKYLRRRMLGYVQKNIEWFY